MPLDALKSLVLRADGNGLTGTRELMAANERRTGERHHAWSALETYLGLRLEHHPHERPEHDLGTHPTHRRCTSAASLRAGFTRSRTRAPIADVPPF